MVRVVSIFSTQNHRAREPRMPELAMRNFPAGHERKARRLQVSNELADFARHELPLPAPAPLRKLATQPHSYRADIVWLKMGVPAPEAPR